MCVAILANLNSIPSYMTHTQSHSHTYTYILFFLARSQNSTPQLLKRLNDKLAVVGYLSPARQEARVNRHPPEANAVTV